MSTQEINSLPHVTYQYPPLPPGPWIRLLRLEPGHDGDALRCSLYPMLLEDAVGQYDALSYVWGAAYPLFTIAVDGSCIRLRKSLFEFLLTLRSKEEPRIFWADAICIDQESIDERNHQVQQMRIIYQNSRTTRVWLGVLDGASEFFQWSPTDNPRMFSTVSSIQTVTRGLTEILSASYWTRLWIIQEIILSREVEVYFSERTLSWDDFVQFCKRGAGELGQNNKLVAKLSSSTMLSLHRQRANPTERSLPDLIKRYRQCLCLDVRDRIFGLLGLADNFDFNVDYALSELELFERVMHAHPPQFAEDFGEQLSLALELSSRDTASTAVGQSPYTIPVCVRECGSVTQHAGRFRWDRYPKQICFPVSYLEDVIVEGDSLYSMSATPLAAVRGRPRFLIVLRRQHELRGCEWQSSGSQSVTYYAAGVLLVLHPYDEIPDSTVIRSMRLLLDARAYRNPVASGLGFGPITMNISMSDFLTLESTYGFGQSDQVPHYDALISPGLLKTSQ